VVWIFFTSLALADQNESFKVFTPQTDETLYFQLTKIANLTSPAGEVCLMDTKFPPDLPFYWGWTWPFFASLPLASPFTFKNINVTVYHQAVSPPAKVTVGIGWYDAKGKIHYFANNSKECTGGIGNSTVSLDVNLSLETGQRLMVWVRVGTENSSCPILFGTEDFPSKIQYEGTASYIPELATELILPLFLTTTLVTVLLKRALNKVNMKSRDNKSWKPFNS
jgi:hypothetical protein